jgi:hypothetical protein
VDYLFKNSFTFSQAFARKFCMILYVSLLSSSQYTPFLWCWSGSSSYGILKEDLTYLTLWLSALLKTFLFCLFWIISGILITFSVVTVFCWSRYFLCWSCKWRRSAKSCCCNWRNCTNNYQQRNWWGLALTWKNMFKVLIVTLYAC